MVVIFIASATPSADIPSYGALDTLVKKGGHFTIYALLAASYLLGFGKTGPRQLVMAVLMAVLYAGSDEFHQSFTSGRHPSVMDVGIDTLGAITGALFFRWLTEKPKLRRYFSR